MAGRFSTDLTDDDFFSLVQAEDAVRRERLRQGGRLVHYTSAEAAYKIIKNGEIWLRSAAVMNDSSEISHGLQCLQQAWASSSGQALQAMLDRLRPGLRDELVTVFDGHAYNLRSATYLISLSDHDDNEDNLGRLSMWRAYGGKAGVALVLNPLVFVGAGQSMKVYSAPVLYADEAIFGSWFDVWTGRLLASELLIKSLRPELVRDVLLLMFRMFAMCTKHRGFSEEREWRVFTSPNHEGLSPWLTYSTEIVQGVPQPLAKIRLVDDAAAGVDGIALKTLLNRVIIGPCEYPFQVRAAMQDAMSHAKVDGIDNKIWMSLIPLRHS